MQVGPLLERLQLFLDPMPQVAVEWVGESLKIRDTVSGHVYISVDAEDERLTLFTEEWHGHFKTEDGAFDAVISLLGGYGRTVQEYKGQTPTASWAEFYDGKAWWSQNVSVLVHPLMPELWELADGESWRLELTQMKVIDAGDWFRRKFPQASMDEAGNPPGTRPGTLSRKVKAPYIEAITGSFAWFRSRYGSPEPGMRWIYDAGRRIVLQIPIAWQCREPEAHPVYLQYTRPSSKAVLSVGTQLHEESGETPNCLPTHPIGPSSVQCVQETVAFGGVVWFNVTWTAEFAVGEHDWRVVVALQLPESEVFEPWYKNDKTLIESAMYKALFVPRPGLQTQA